MSGRGQKTHPVVRELSGGPARSLGGNAGSLGGQPAGPGMVGTHFRMSLKSGRPFRMTGNCRVAFPDVRVSLSVVREACPDVRETLLVAREWLGDPPGCLGVLGGPHKCPGGLADVREWSGGPPGCRGVVEKPSRMSRSGREALPDVREWSGGPLDSLGGPTRSLGGQPGGPGMVGTPSRMSLRGGRPFRMFGSCRVALPDVWEASPQVREWSGDSPGCLGVVERHS